MDNYQRDRSGRYSVVDDPTGSGRGKVLKCEAAPDLAYYDKGYFGGIGQTVVRSYPANYFPSISGPHLIGLDVYVVDNFSPSPRDSAPNLSLLSDFYDTGGYGKAWSFTALVNVAVRAGIPYLQLGLTGDARAVLYSDAPPFTFNKWHRIEMLFTSDRRVTLFQDGHPVATGRLPGGVPLATAGGHPGLYGLSGQAEKTAPFSSGTLYNDNWTMVVWPP